IRSGADGTPLHGRDQSTALHSNHVRWRQTRSGWPGKLKSSLNWPRPVSKRASSVRGIGWPMKRKLVLLLAIGLQIESMEGRAVERKPARKPTNFRPETACCNRRHGE